MQDVAVDRERLERLKQKEKERIIKEKEAAKAKALKEKEVAKANALAEKEAAKQAKVAAKQAAKEEAQAKQLTAKEQAQALLKLRGGRGGRPALRAAERELLRRAEARPEDAEALALFERVGARIHALIDPKPIAHEREAARAMLARGDAVGARKLILEYMQPFMGRGEEAGILMNYLPRRVVADLGVTRLRALLRANQVGSPDLPRIEQLQALIGNRESREDYLMAAELELGELEALQQRAYDAAFVEALKAARERPPESRVLRERTARCPVVSDLGPVTPAPKVNTILSTPTANYFPPEALAQGVEGKVAVYARVTPEGCVRAAGVLVSTGVDALDAAALRWMLEGAVFSRSTPLKGGELATTMLNVNFKSPD